MGDLKTVQQDQGKDSRKWIFPNRCDCLFLCYVAQAKVNAGHSGHSSASRCAEVRTSCHFSEQSYASTLLNYQNLVKGRAQCSFLASDWKQGRCLSRFQPACPKTGSIRLLPLSAQAEKTLPILHYIGAKFSNADPTRQWPPLPHFGMYWKRKTGKPAFLKAKSSHQLLAAVIITRAQPHLRF